LTWRKAWNKLNRLKKEDTIKGLMSFWGGEAALVGHRFGKKFDISHHCWLQGQDAKKENHYIRWIRPEASELIAISDFVQSEFTKNHFIKPQYVIPLGIDPREFPLQNGNRDIDILGAGSLIPLKRYEIFIQVVGRLKPRFPHIKAVLCGKGPEEAKLKQLINEAGLQNNIILKGELAHPDLLHQMKRARLFLHTSVYEGFGTVCTEALYAGTSVISFCKPMNAVITNWHNVRTLEEMEQIAGEILNDPAPDYKTVLPYMMQETVEKVMRLYFTQSDTYPV
jgi:glycosyltransferase involved in cell wall biosynthesis